MGYEWGEGFTDTSCLALTHTQPPKNLETQVKDTKLSPIIKGHLLRFKATQLSGFDLTPFSTLTVKVYFR